MVERREPRAAAAPPRREPQRRAPPTVTIDRALLDRNLLGAGLGDAASWQTWLVVLRAAFALDLSAAERAIFTSVAGERAVPTKRVNELWCLVSRNGGKSRIAAALAVYFSIFTPRTLAAGERGIVLVLAASTAQAQTVFHYALGFLQASPVLRAEISSLTTTEIRLRNHTTIAVAPNSYRTVRGRTLQACICDEISFWGDESSATPDVEAYRAVLPALARTNGMLVGISTGYKRAGLLHEKWRDHYGVDGDAVLVVQGASRAFNPTLDAAVIAAACAADPEAAAAEWQGGFRDDICGVFDDALIAAAVDSSRPLELPPRSGITYRCMVDPSGGRGAAYCIAIAHREGDRFIIDLLRGRTPPFDPQEVTREFAALAKLYSLHEVTGDAYSAAWVVASWRDNGISYVPAVRNKSTLYLEALPCWTRGAVRIPEHAQLLRELRLLERRVSRVGRDLIDTRNGSDDHANVVCGVVALLAGTSTYASDLRWVDGDGDGPEAAMDAWRRLELQSILFAR